MMCALGQKRGGDIAMTIEIIEETRDVSIEALYDHITSG